MTASIANAMGYMTAQHTLTEGFTHHGKMYGVPCWIGEPDGFAPMVAAKWAPMELMLSLGHWVTGWTMALMGVPGYFALRVGPPIAKDGGVP